MNGSSGSPQKDGKTNVHVCVQDTQDYIYIIIQIGSMITLYPCFFHYNIIITNENNLQPTTQRFSNSVCCVFFVMLHSSGDFAVNCCGCEPGGSHQIWYYNK